MMLRAFSMISITTMLLACADDGDRAPLPNWKDGYEGSGDDEKDTASDDVVQMGKTREFPEATFGLGMPDIVTYPYRLRELGTKAELCAAGGDFDAEVTCVLDLDELDLYLLGFMHDIIVPHGFCDFVLLSPYMFQNWEAGVGPDTVSWEIGETSEGDAGDEVGILNEVNAQGGVPYCEFDHSDAEGPNCCIGTYTETLTNHKTGEVSTRKGDWGGKLSDCYDGGAFLRDGVEFDDNGWPKDVYYYLDKEPAVLSVSYRQIADERGMGTNVFLSNYYDPEDHNGTFPLALNETTRPMYEILCVDDAYEVIAAVHLVVREWNEEVEFDADGDPDTVGTEEAWNHPLDDISDFKVLTPSDDTLPYLPVAR